ncbi:MAG: hypothetical protein GFH27_549289n64 [Chloroflexi bacterium AL-W]|nr:hypothetical protein [Chloroflexi bacterium AL-N1]NOK66796.1 hypothetical protein [Chloroflexi bacterium AL-N10]NOK74912.1 hypothetical protein [Chloroflexi bacterium AL-N5]NOK81399.1 hypothetical protein [Chloroflexi bacterium AL-W]NOK88868.1 hypothetical protein [Chloroflexi bacterium AL-N15]
MSGADQSTSITLNAFEKRLKQALRLYDKPERLGADSPLANTYFLSHTFRDVPRPITLQALGKALRDEIYAAASQLWGGPLPRDRSEMQTKLSEVRQEPESPRRMWCWNYVVSSAILTPSYVRYLGAEPSVAWLKVTTLS